MKSETEPLGTVVDEATVCIERLLPGPIDRLWGYLTDSEKRGLWLATGEMDPEKRTLDLHFNHADLSAEDTPERFAQYAGGHHLSGRILEWDPPRLLSFTWEGEPGGVSEVTFELSEVEELVKLVLTHRKLGSRAGMLSVASGWHTHVGILIDRLNGDEPRPFWTTHAGLELQYAAAIPVGPRTLTEVEAWAKDTTRRITRQDQWKCVALSRQFGQSSDDLWAAWTDPVQLSAWLGDVEGDFLLDGIVQVDVGLEQKTSCRVLRCVPTQSLCVTWVHGNSPTEPPDEVELELQAQDGATRLTLTHRSIEPEAWEPGVGIGWEIWLLRLEDFLDGRDPDAVVWEESEPRIALYWNELSVEFSTE